MVSPVHTSGKAFGPPFDRIEMPVRLLRTDWPPNDGLMPGDEHFDAMLESVREEGIRDPLTINIRWLVIDGAHRLYVARLLGIEWVPVRIWTGIEFIPPIARSPTEPEL